MRIPIEGIQLSLGKAFIHVKSIKLLEVIGNLVSAGRSLPALWVPGSINTILLLDANLKRSALVGALVTATEAKVGALFERELRTPEGYPRPAPRPMPSSLPVLDGRGASLRWTGDEDRMAHRSGHQERDRAGNRA